MSGDAARISFLMSEHFEELMFDCRKQHAVPMVEGQRSHECERGTQECVRHAWMKLKSSLYETTEVEVDAVVFRGSGGRDLLIPTRPGGAAGENQEGGWNHGPI